MGKDETLFVQNCYMKQMNKNTELTKIPELLEEMISFSEGNIHDINHLLKVFSFAQTIGKSEKLSETEQVILEAAALVHDIACAMCRVKYGNTNGPYQEKEGSPLAEKVLSELGFSSNIIERVVFLVSHHHTYSNVDGLDYQILLEADFLVNADESQLSKTAIEEMKKRVFKTETGIRLLDSMYLTDYTSC